jgi:hypothetical protein
MQFAKRGKMSTESSRRDMCKFKKNNLRIVEFFHCALPRFRGGEGNPWGWQGCQRAASPSHLDTSRRFMHREAGERERKL